MARLINRPRGKRNAAASDDASNSSSSANPPSPVSAGSPRRFQDSGSPSHYHHNTHAHPQAVCVISRQNITMLMIGMMIGYIVLPIVMLQEITPVDDVAARLKNTNLNTVIETKKFPIKPYIRTKVEEDHPVDIEAALLAPPRAMFSTPEEAALAKAPVDRIRENFDLLSTQSIPTSTTPKVFYTKKLPDSKRLKILVTGGAGFVGSHLVDKLMVLGHEVKVLDNFFTGQKKNIEHWLHHPNFSLVTHDVTEPIMLEVDQIYHLACPASPPHYQYNPIKTIKTSTMGTINMLGLAKRVRARMLLTSTSEVYGDPKEHPQKETYWGNVNTIGPRSCYDEGKRVAETMMYSYRDQAEVEVRVARIFNTFGPRMHPNDGRVVSNFIIQALQNKPLTVYGDGSQTRSFQYVSDLVEGLYNLMNGDYDLPVNLGNPDEYSIRKFADHIKDITNSSSIVKMLPASKDDPSQRRPDITVAKERINWEPVITVKEGLKHTIEYFSRVLSESGEIIPTGPGASKPEA